MSVGMVLSGCCQLPAAGEWATFLGGAVEGSLSSKFPGGGGFSIFLRGNFPGREEEKLEKRKSI